MTRMVNCVLLKCEAEGLDRVPWPGELGRRIYEGVSKEAWRRWLEHQTMLINEYRLSALDPKARQFLSWRDGEVLLRQRRSPTGGLRGARAQRVSVPGRTCAS
jgi:Fe-S cluster biosynthesis and repair protein YggX